ncbi:unknown [Mycoplasma sp. CAG:472]|jgi:predicted RNA-binding protein with PIN domain|nr:unknown [Mycoplasma sp. CAG:472]
MDLVGKTLCDETGEEYVVLKLINYKAIKCAYAVSVNSDEKKIFQVSGNGLISIDSKKMINDITQMLIDSKDIKDEARKIKDGEAIADYFKYLDEFYKTRINTIM